MKALFEACLRWVDTRWWWLATVMLVLVSYFSLLPLPQLPDVPGTDKLHHFIAYALVVFPIAVRRPKFWLGYALILFAYSGVIEILQPYVNRYGEWLDLLANGAGILIGIAAAWVCLQLSSSHARDLGRR